MTRIARGALGILTGVVAEVGRCVFCMSWLYTRSKRQGRGNDGCAEYRGMQTAKRTNGIAGGCARAVTRQ